MLLSYVNMYPCTLPKELRSLQQHLKDTSEKCFLVWKLFCSSIQPWFTTESSGKKIPQLCWQYQISGHFHILQKATVATVGIWEDKRR